MSSKPVGLPDERLGRVAALRKAGRLAEAAQLAGELLDEQPSTSVLNQLGAIRAGMEDWAAAARHLQRSLRMDPGQPLVSMHLGNVLLHLGQHEQALAAHTHAVSLQPGLVEARLGMAKSLALAGRDDESVGTLAKAAQDFPSRPEVHHARGKLLRRLGRLREADDAFAEVLRLDPAFVPALIFRGLLAAEGGDVTAGVGFARQAVVAAPSRPYPKAVLADLLLLHGDYSEGWMLNESRHDFERAGENPGTRKIPLWDGKAPLEGRTLMVQPEIGLGDYLMFARYVPLVRERGGEPVLMAPAPLVPLLGTLDGSPTIIPRGSPLPRLDYRCPVMSFAHVFRTTLDTIPNRFPYLHADPVRRQSWRARLGPVQQPRIGLVWSGKNTREIDGVRQRRRTMDVRALAPLMELPLEFHSLQKECSAADAAWLAAQPALHDHRAEIGDFADTAALAAEMDLVLSIDTSVAHVAGALALPLWVMLPFASDYRWNPQLPASPWYPQARIFRQPSPGDWEAVGAQVSAALRSRFLQASA